MNPHDLIAFLPAAITLAAVIGILAFANYLIRRNLTGELSVGKQAFMLLMTATGIIVFIFSLPLSETSRGQVLSLLGIVITAVIALSSTTFVSNIMAGLMLRAVNSFRPGDFIRCEEYFGRVTERGLFHTEIQTPDRDLATVPNLFLVNNPLTVVHESGTIISANLSLGYDVSHVRIEEMLKQAADETGLTDSFVLVQELNDFSVGYRVAGFSDDVNRLLTIKSNLRKNILQVLHSSGIEIVSPNFMSQRQLAPETRIIPSRYREKTPATGAESAPEDVIFDKADTAAEKESMKQELTDIKLRLDEVAARRKSTPDDADALDREKTLLENRMAHLAEMLKEKENGDDRK